MGIVNPSRHIEARCFESTMWKDFTFRTDDIIIATYGKSGTTWMQQIVSQLIFSGEENLPVAEMSPWLEFGPVVRNTKEGMPTKKDLLEQLEAQKHRRFIKTHLPADALTRSDQAKYIFIGRDGRDVAWSFFNHHKGANQMMYDLLEYQGDKLPQPIEPIEEYFRNWLENDGEPWWPFWEHIKTWWDLRDQDNLLLVHFNELKEDLPGQIQHIAEFLDIEVNQEVFDTIVKHCSFDYMKQNGDQMVPLGGALWDGKAQTFINKGTNRRWSETLTVDDSTRYYSNAFEKLEPECALWLSQGNSPEDLAILQRMME